MSLPLFAWLLSLHPTAAGRVYAYIDVAILWLWAVDKVTPSTTDWIGVAVSFLGMAIMHVWTSGARSLISLTLVFRLERRSTAVRYPSGSNPGACAISEAL